MPRYKNKENRKSSFTKPEPLTKIIPKPLKALTEKQADYIHAIKRSKQVVSLGPAGTGKTYVAASLAADAFAYRDITKIVLTRPSVPVDEDFGFLPGSLGEKVAPWVVPFTEVLEDRLGSDRYRAMLRRNDVEIVPLGYMRGRTFTDAYVILDEAQNTTYAQMKMFLTRIGEGAKVLINGDIRQSDLKHESGLKIILDMIKQQNLDVPVIEFSVADVIRSDVCKMWTEAFIKYETNNDSK